MTDPAPPPPTEPALARFDNPDFVGEGDRDLRAAYAAFNRGERISPGERARVARAEAMPGFLEAICAPAPLTAGARLAAEILAPEIGRAGLSENPRRDLEAIAKRLEGEGRTDLAADIRAADVRRIRALAGSTFAASEAKRTAPADVNALSPAEWQRHKARLGM